jgi:sugar (pentulose or hexulose) kinase
MATDFAANENVIPIASEPETDSHFTLGIDLGSTTVKICVIDSRTKVIVYEKSRKTNADITDVSGTYVTFPQVRNFDGFSEQDVRKIWQTLNSLLSELNISVAEKIKVS